MASSDAELVTEIRRFIQYDEVTISDSELKSDIDRAKRQIATRITTLDAPGEVQWYANAERENALFWYSCLYAMITAGEVDAPAIEIGNLTTQNLNSAQTEVYHSAQKALRVLESDHSSVTTIEREEREYVGGGGFGR